MYILLSLGAPILIAGICFAVVLAGVWTKRSSGTRLPPGPKGYPIIGNLFDIPTSFQWLTFTKWGDLYGDLCSVRVPGTTIIIINSYAKALEMLDKKGVIYSDRPHIPLLGDMMGWDETTGLANGAVWKAGRKLLQQEVGTHASLISYQSRQLEEAKGFLTRLAQSPNRFKEHIEQYITAIILDAAYGYKVKQEDDPLVLLVNESNDLAIRAITPGAFWVNHIPILKYVPSWFPGASFQKFAAYGRECTERTYNEPFNYVKKQMAEGKAQTSFTSQQLAAGAPEDLIKKTAGTYFSAGSDTLVATVYAFFHALVHHSEVQKRAQEELDSVLGPNTLPTFADRESLPYFDALMKEVTRCYIVAPLALPHCTSEDDVQDGYFIPKQSIVIANSWKMCRDPELYKDPLTFNPSRFLGDNPELDPNEIAFGFGRRACAGRLLAEGSMYILCASTLATFNVTPALDDITGKPNLPSYETLSAAVAHLQRFKCNIKPRFSQLSF